VGSWENSEVSLFQWATVCTVSVTWRRPALNRRLHSYKVQANSVRCDVVWSGIVFVKCDKFNWVHIHSKCTELCPSFLFRFSYESFSERELFFKQIKLASFSHKAHFVVAVGSDFRLPFIWNFVSNTLQLYECMIHYLNACGAVWTVHCMSRPVLPRETLKI
jgi:hypothetical protein